MRVLTWLSKTLYYTGIQGMPYFQRDYGYKTAEGTYKLATTFLSASASIIYVGELVGSVAAGPINDAFGRKAVFLAASLCIMIGAIIQVNAYGIDAVFYIGRIFVGLGIGQFTSTSLMYLAEVAPAPLRGPALMMFQFTQSVAQFVGACVNEGTKDIKGTASYMLPMGLLIVLPLIMCICLLFVPESPVWYVYKDRPEQALRALRSVNRSMANYDAETELQVVQEQVREEKELLQQSSWSSLFRNPTERRKLIYACGAMVAQQINGIQFWYTYGVVFAQSINVGAPFTINTIIYIVQIITVGLSVIFGNRMKRRLNLLVCTVGMIVSLLCVGGLGATHPGGPYSRGTSIGIVVFAFFNIVFFNFSIGTLSYTIASEMSVGPNRNKITACAMGVFFFMVWLMVFTSPYMYYTANLGPMLGFVYAGTSLVTLAYVWFCVGETANRTNAELEYLLSNNVPVRQWEQFEIPSTHAMAEKANHIDDQKTPVAISYVEKA